MDYINLRFVEASPAVVVQAFASGLSLSPWGSIYWRVSAGSRTIDSCKVMIHTVTAITYYRLSLVKASLRNAVTVALFSRCSILFTPESLSICASFDLDDEVEMVYSFRGRVFIYLFILLISLLHDVPPSGPAVTRPLLGGGHMGARLIDRQLLYSGRVTRLGASSPHIPTSPNSSWRTSTRTLSHHSALARRLVCCVEYTTGSPCGRFESNDLSSSVLCRSSFTFPPPLLEPSCSGLWVYSCA